MYKFGTKFIDESSIASIDKIIADIPYKNANAGFFEKSFLKKSIELIVVKLKKEAELGDFFHPIRKYYFYYDADGSNKKLIDAFLKKSIADIEYKNKGNGGSVYSDMYSEYVFGAEWYSVTKPLDDIIDSL